MDYIEEQQLNSKLLFIIFFVCGVAMITGVIISMREMSLAGEDYLNMVWIAISLLALQALIFYFMFRIKLITEVNKIGFHYSYSPIIRRKKVIDFGEMISWQLKSKQNFRDQMNIGYKKNSFVKKISFNMGSNEYLEIITKKHYTYIFSTDNHYGLTSALRKYCSQKEI